MFMNDNYIFLLLEYSMCFTLCGYQTDIKFDVIQTFQELHPALATADCIYCTQPHVHCPATEAKEHHTGMYHVIDFKTAGKL